MVSHGINVIAGKRKHTIERGIIDLDQVRRFDRAPVGSIPMKRHRLERAEACKGKADRPNIVRSDRGYAVDHVPRIAVCAGRD